MSQDNTIRERITTEKNQNESGNSEKTTAEIKLPIDLALKNNHFNIDDDGNLKISDATLASLLKSKVDKAIAEDELSSVRVSVGIDI